MTKCWWTRGTAWRSELTTRGRTVLDQRRLSLWRIPLRCVLLILLAGFVVWVAAALWFDGPPARWLAGLIAGAFVIGSCALLLFLRPFRRGVVSVGVLFLIVLMWWFQIPASNERDWQPEVAVTPWAEREGDLITIHGVRNLDYRTETDFTPRWETRTYDLSKLDSVDLISVYWGSKAIAHTMMSFGFEGKDYLTMSIETRKERGEDYSTIAGFFRQYELVYIVADERDVIRVRTTYRQPQEDVYVYRVRAPRENIHRGFLDYIKTMNEMRERPRFYNTLTTNCTTGIWLHTRMNPESPPLSWKILLSGYVPDYLYELGRLDTTRPFAELEKLSRVNERAHAADKDRAFSQRIREGLPLPPPLS
jgi:hypothetical protein